MAQSKTADDMSAFREIALQAGVPHEALDEAVRGIPVYQPAGQVHGASGEGVDHALDTLFDGWPNG